MKGIQRARDLRSEREIKGNKSTIQFNSIQKLIILKHKP